MVITFNYYSVGFSYKYAKRGFGGPGFHVALSVDEDEETRKLFAAEKEVHKALKEHNITFEHAYSYPDGSLYRYIETEMSEYDLRAKLTNILPEHAPFKISDVMDVNAALVRFGRAPIEQSRVENLVQAMVEDGVDRTMSLNEIDSLLLYVQNNSDEFIKKVVAVLEQQKKDYLT